MKKVTIILIFLCSKVWAGEYTSKQACYSGSCDKKVYGKFKFKVTPDRKTIFFANVRWDIQKSKKIKGGYIYYGLGYTLTVTERTLTRTERDLETTYRNEKK